MAVHLEMTFGLDITAFLNVFYRMVNGRGLPMGVITDNGGYFAAANKELKALKELKSSDLYEKNQKSNITSENKVAFFNVKVGEGVLVISADVSRGH